MTDGPIDVSYDAGHFDKDEQGWVEDPVRVVQEGDLLRVERSGRVETLRLGRRFPRAGLVELLSTAPHPWWRLFDLAAGRLVGGPVPTTRALSRPAPTPGLRDDPLAALAPLVAGCAAATRVLYPASTVAPPGREALARLLAEPGRSLRLDAPADPGMYLLVWRDAQGAYTGCSARSATEVGAPYASAGLGSSGLDLHVGAPTLEAMEAAFAALGVGPG